MYLLRDVYKGAGRQLGEGVQGDGHKPPSWVAGQQSLRQLPHLPNCVKVTVHVLEDWDEFEFGLDWSLQTLDHLSEFVTNTRRKTPVNIKSHSLVCSIKVT